MVNRVDEIIDQSIVNKLKHVKGLMNPVDIGTRGVTVSKLLESE